MKLRFACLVLYLLFTHVQPALAATPVNFSISVGRAIVRSGPGTTFSAVKTVTLGQTFTVTGRTANNDWLRLTVPRLAGEAWVKASLGKVKGDLTTVPLAGTSSPVSTTVAQTPTAIATVAAPLYSTTGPTTPAVAASTPRARDIYQTGLALGNNPRAFSKVGDCQSAAPFFLASFDAPGQYRLGENGYLQETIENFSGSFSRESMVAKNGLNTASVLSPLWADPKKCNKGESALECEYRLHRPAFAIISLGTNGAWQSDADYESAMRRIIDISIERGVVPILSTKADDVEGGNRFNFIVSKLAAEYDLPLWNFWAAASTLPSFGLADTYHLSWGRLFLDDPVSMSKGWAWRNLTALQSLDSVWKGVK
ncbi:MAG TPA: SH3 domain-containing protein [Anaerolineales bacterium]|nr:SH3 domain-containing protein [Anaerolineales bacterium]